MEELRKKYIGYCRVSTKKQGDSGLGLLSQESQIEDYVNRENGTLIAKYKDVDSGKKRNRESLTLAMDLAKKEGAVLIIAKLDRLARDVEFIFSLKNSGVVFCALDVPEFNTLSVGIFATMAEHERERISERTVKALAKKKELGFKLGTPENLTDLAREKSKLARKEKSKEHGEKVYELIYSLRIQGKSFREIACIINRTGLKSSRGKEFKAMTVKRIFDRFYFIS